MRFSGTPVHLDTMCMMSSPVTTTSRSSRCSRHPFNFCSSLSVVCFSESRSAAAFSKSCALIAASFSARIVSIFFSISFTSGGRVIELMRARFVHDIDGLVRQETASNISIGKPNGCFQCLVGKLGLVMGLVLRAQAFQNLNCFFERWRFDLDCLESAFERCIFFDVLAVLIEGGGSNTLQFAPAECRLDNV